jgi:HKD family nuclease
MHYPDMNPQAIDKSKPTMKGLKGKIDQSKELSEIDIKEIRKLYNCKSAGILTFKFSNKK